jgi:glyoxylase-like metal-dependent hydrolase (beta-lactamase superfamily II)
MIDVQCLELPPIGTNCWLLADRGRGEAVIADAPLSAFAAVGKWLDANGCRLTAVLFTHGHWDHTLDGWRYNEAGIPTYGHRGDEGFFSNPTSMAPFAIPGLEMRPLRINHWVAPGATIELLGRQVELRHVPGHSAGSVLYWFRDDGVAVSGDALFSGSIGRTDFPGCSFEQLAASITGQIYTLPDHTRILPGHGPETTVGEEALTNPFVRLA